jgi:GH24 family phage-related lysozyme (muramidase)
MNTSENGFALIRSNEGLGLKQYLDQGKWAIGYGHDLLPGETYPNGIDQSTAQKILEKDVASWDVFINHLAPQANQNQHDALADFTHQFGPGGLQQLLSHGWDQVTVQMPRWIHMRNAAGIEVVSPNLVARRNKEIALFNS